MKLKLYKKKKKKTAMATFFSSKAAKHETEGRTRKMPMADCSRSRYGRGGAVDIVSDVSDET